MNLFRKLALAGVGLAFVLGLAVTESSAQWRGRSYGNRSYGRVYIQYGSPSYGRYNRSRSYGRYRNSYYGGNRYGSYYNRNRYGLSWRERRILAIRRARAIRAMNRYQRTRARILNRRAYRNAYSYRNW
jgi:hypothetical protein